jgi:chromosomal replication initiator protein
MNDHPLPLTWQRICDAVRPHVGNDTFQRWFASVALDSLGDQRLVLRVPNSIHQLWIESNYLPLLKAAMIQVLGGPREVEFACTDNSPRMTEEHVPMTVSESDDDAETADTASKAGRSKGVNGTVLNPRYVFDSFVVGANNQFAHAAAQAVAQAPSRTYNPLFIYGGVGLGKTHLMQAIGHYVQQTKKNTRVIYLTSEQFTNEFIEAIQHSTLVKFRKRYRQADVLLIDDIQFFAGRERSQEEFFHTFNTLFDGHKQIVLSSDRPASEIGSLQDRLVNRFEWGLTAELQPPDIETRIAILRKKADALQTRITTATLEFLAKRIRSNVRRLEGALVKVASYQSLSGQDVEPEAAERFLKDILQEEAKRTISIDQIQRKVAEHFDVRLADMTSKRRPANIAFPRQVAMYLARELTQSSLNEIGDAFGGRDHGTVLHAHKTIKRKMDEEEKVRHTVSYLDSILQR